MWDQEKMQNFTKFVVLKEYDSSIIKIQLSVN